MCLLLVLLVNWSQMKPAIGSFLCVRLNFLLLLKIYWRLTNNKMVYFRHQLVWSVDQNDLLPSPPFFFFFLYILSHKFVILRYWKIIYSIHLSSYFVIYLCLNCILIFSKFCIKILLSVSYFWQYKITCSTDSSCPQNSHLPVSCLPIFRLNFVCCRLLNNATSGAWGSDVACVCADCCQVRGFPAELGYFNTVAAGCFSCPQVEATPITWYLAPGMRTLPGNPPRNAIGLVLSSNWAGFVAKTWQPWQPLKWETWNRNTAKY